MGGFIWDKSEDRQSEYSVAEKGKIHIIIKERHKKT